MICSDIVCHRRIQGLLHLGPIIPMLLSSMQLNVANCYIPRPTMSLFQCGVIQQQHRLLPLLINKRRSSMKMVPFHSLESSLINLSLDLECFFFSLVKYIILIIKQVMVLHKYGAVSPVGTNLTNLSLDLEWFVFSLVKSINLIIK